MDERLLQSIEKLHLISEAAKDPANLCVDAKLFDPRPRIKEHPSRTELKARLVKDFLTPPITFGPEWLNKFQV